MGASACNLPRSSSVTGSAAKASLEIAATPGASKRLRIVSSGEAIASPTLALYSELPAISCVSDSWPRNHPSRSDTAAGVNTTSPWNLPPIGCVSICRSVSRSMRSMPKYSCAGRDARSSAEPPAKLKELDLLPSRAAPSALIE